MPRTVDRGAVFAGAVVTGTFLVRNLGPREVTVTRVSCGSPEATASVSARAIPAGGAVELSVRQPTADLLGEQTIRCALLTDAEGRRRFAGEVRVFVQSAFDPERGSVSFGRAEKSTGASAEIDLCSREVDRLEVLGIDGLPVFLRGDVVAPAAADGEAASLRLRLLPGAPLGPIGGVASVRTNVPHQPVFRLSWSGEVWGDVVPDDALVALGTGRPGDVLFGETRLRRRDGRKLTVGRVFNPWPPLRVVDAPCGGPEAEGCRRISLWLTLEPGMQVDGLLRVFVSGEEEPLPIRYAGTVLGSGGEVRELGEMESPAADGPAR